MSPCRHAGMKCSDQVQSNRLLFQHFLGGGYRVAVLCYIRCHQAQDIWFSFCSMLFGGDNWAQGFVFTSAVGFSGWFLSVHGSGGLLGCFLRVSRRFLLLRDASMASVHSIWFMELRLVQMGIGCSGEIYIYFGLFLPMIASRSIVWFTVSSHSIVLDSRWSHSHGSILYFFLWALLLDTTDVFGNPSYSVRAMDKQSKYIALPN